MRLSEELSKHQVITFSKEESHFDSAVYIDPTNVMNYFKTYEPSLDPRQILDYFLDMVLSQDFSTMNQGKNFY